jgi:hypothetical protein
VLKNSKSPSRKRNDDAGSQLVGKKLAGGVIGFCDVEKNHHRAK